ncbi:MAG: hypothetical protein HOV67_20190 [Kribbellaceae bacterium]|nr:hypothetical protein [Kribbellaceae bacterium]
MGQFDSYIERNAPPSPRTARAYGVLMPAAAIPKATDRAYAALDRHTVPSILFGFAFSLAGAFALLRAVTSYSTSLYIAIPIALALTTYGAIRRHNRHRSATP